MTRPNGFEGLRRQNRGQFHVDAPIDVVFPLFGAEAEARWAPGWRPEWVYPSRERARSVPPDRGWVFRTDGDTLEERIWYVAAYSEETHEVTYLVHWPRLMVYRIDVRSRPDAGGTVTTVVYDFCGLSAEGNELVERRTADPDEFAREMRQWAERIAGYLRDEERVGRAEDASAGSSSSSACRQECGSRNDSSRC